MRKHTLTPTSAANSPKTQKRRRRVKILPGLVGAIAIVVSSLGVPAAQASPSEPSEQYILTVDGKEYTLDQNERIQIPLVPVNNESSPSLIQTKKQVHIGNRGVLTVWGKDNKFHWDIVMVVPTTSFTGHVRVTDLTSGLSSGRKTVHKFGGSVAANNYKNHRYNGYIEGTAYFAGVPVAKTNRNGVSWVNK